MGRITVFKKSKYPNYIHNISLPLQVMERRDEQLQSLLIEEMDSVSMVNVRETLIDCILYLCLHFPEMSIVRSAKRCRCCILG
jgi:hypothetical protein